MSKRIGKDEPQKISEVIVDRIEGDTAVCEYGDMMFDIPRALLPEKTKEGDTLDIRINIDQTETERRRRKIEDLTDELFE